MVTVISGNNVTLTIFVHLIRCLKAKNKAKMLRNAEVVILINRRHL